MTRDEKKAIKSQRYRTYSIEHVSFDHSEPIENQDNGEEIPMKTQIGFAMYRLVQVYDFSYHI